MAIIEPRIFDLKGGSRIIVRAGTEADAPALLEHQAHMIATDPNTVSEPQDPKRTLAEQLKSIQDHIKEPGQLLVVATLDGAPLPILGGLSFRAGDRRKVRHHGHFGLSVHADWRGKGVGSALITTLLDWAAAHPHLEKVCLGVFEVNTGAQRLYRRLGFVQESLAPNFFKLGPGRYVADLWMANYVKPGIAPDGFKTWTARS